MNTGQTMLTGLALVLLGATIFSVNRNSLNNGTVLRQTELGIYAVSLATSYIQRASELDWDEYTVSGLVYITVPMNTVPVTSGSNQQATAPNLLGPETSKGENATVDTAYDDFDDYNGFSKDTTMGASSLTAADKFHVTAKVYYVSQSPINGKYTKVTANATWSKQIDITVNSKIDRSVFQNARGDTKTATDTIRLSYIYAFYR